MIEGVIYRYKSPSGKYYIGQTINEERRRRCFLYDRYYGGSKIDRARRKYGPENFEYTVLIKITGDNTDEVKQYLDTLEIGFIKMYDSVKNGYNITAGGEGCVGFHHTEESKRKISESHKGKTSNRKGCHLSEETRRKIGESKKGNRYMLGHKLSLETRQKLSESLKGRKTWNKGIPMSDEQKKKLSDAHKGKPAPIKGRHKVYNPDGTYRMIKDSDPITPLW